MDIEGSISRAAEVVSEADAVFISAGAGIGVDSGLPDFRGNEGFWRAYPPIAKLGISFVEMANPRWFDIKPRLAWAFYGHRLNLYRSTKPHKGFDRLFEIGSNKNGGYFVFTSNVDGQFQKAGFDDNLIEECHGSIHHMQCTKVCSDDIWNGEETQVEVDEEKFEAPGELPKCKNCGTLARPNILMFGDWMWNSHRTESQSIRLNNWLSEVSESNYKLVVIETGAGQAVPTVRMKSEYVSHIHNATLIRINPRDYHTPPGNISIPLGSREGIERICEEM
ncbi:NAD-dependent deacetylase [candidate division KSB1 bacterium]